MQRIIMTAAAMLLGAALAATTAKADMNYGPIQDKGLCFKGSPTSEGVFGFWTECPKPAAATTTTTVHHRHAKHS